MKSLLKTFTPSILISAVLLFGVAFKLGGHAFLTVVILSILEITFSFENAVINAKILSRMSKFWQRIFLTLGILIAVFGVRVFLPLLIVSVASKLGLGEITRLALNDSTKYAEYLHASHPIIAGFGGIFLLMLFLDFILEDRQIKWLRPIEERFARIGKAENISVVIGCTAILLSSRFLADTSSSQDVLTAGIVGLITYLSINALDKLVTYNSMNVDARSGVRRLLGPGLIGFLYLELIDASFSLDGVVGAFAISSNIILIAIGLGIGAMFVRSLTVHLMRSGTLAKYTYLEHGAHYAIGVLAIVLILTIRFDIPEAVTGMSGLILIILALLSSNKKRSA